MNRTKTPLRVELPTQRFAVMEPMLQPFKLSGAHGATVDMTVCAREPMMLRCIQWRTYDEHGVRAHGAELLQLVHGHRRKLISHPLDVVGIRSPVRLRDASFVIDVADTIVLTWWFPFAGELRGYFTCHALRYPEPDLSRPLWPAVEP